MSEKEWMSMRWIQSSQFFFFKQKTTYDMRSSDWSSDVCSSDLQPGGAALPRMRAAIAGDPVGRIRLVALEAQLHMIEPRRRERRHARGVEQHAGRDEVRVEPGRRGVAHEFHEIGPEDRKSTRLNSSH